MDFQAALEFATERNAATVIGLQIHGRSIGYEQSVLKQNQLSGEALSLNYFVAPLSEDELDSALNEEGEALLHRLLDGSPDPQRCINARDKAAFTSWCISALAQRNG